MSDRDSFQDPSSDAYGTSGKTAREGVGNRPAENARLATSPSNVDHGAPQENGAGDFLGLGFELEAHTKVGSSAADGTDGIAPGAPGPVLPAWMAEAESATAQAGQSWLLQSGENGPIAEPQPSEELVAASNAAPTTSFKERGLHGFASVWGVRLLLGAAAASLVFVTLHVYKSAQAPSDDAVANAPAATKQPSAGGATSGASTKPGQAPASSSSSTKTASAPSPDAAGTASANSAALTSSPAGAAVAANSAEVALPSWWPVSNDAASAPSSEPVLADAAGTDPNANTGTGSNGDSNSASSYVTPPRSSDGRVDSFVESHGEPASSIASLVPWTRSPAMPAGSSVRDEGDSLARDLNSTEFDDPSTIVFADTQGTEANAADAEGLYAELAALPRAVETADLAGMWLEATIPLDHVGDATRLLTPAVGMVRVILTNDEVFEGRLHAVGENKIWLETSLGRMGLVDTQVARIEAASTPSGAQIASTRQQLMPTVRVQTAEGIVYGHLAARTQHDLTLILESGLESTVVPTAVQAAPKNLAVLGVTKAVLSAPKGPHSPTVKAPSGSPSKSSKPKRN